jgi:hypothetical protein
MTDEEFIKALFEAGSSQVKRDPIFLDGSKDLKEYLDKHTSKENKEDVN